jgi:hypothetical protein
MGMVTGAASERVQIGKGRPNEFWGTKGRAKEVEDHQSLKDDPYPGRTPLGFKSKRNLATLFQI